jgi:putative sigma-54 modulation protein
MELEFIARNTELTDQQKDLAKKKISRLSKYFNAVHEARLTVGQEKHRVTVEAFIRGKDFEVAASAESGDWSSSLQEVVAKLEEQARRLKQKLTTRKRQRDRSGGDDAHWQVAVVDRDLVKSGQTLRLDEVRHVPVLPMTVEEAALQLESAGEDFIVFREADTDRINVLYRRGDRAYGLVTPEF